MALELMDEHERGETVRAWLRQNGGSIVTGIAVGLALIFGWQWYQRSKVEHRVTAATQYQALTDAVEGKDVESVASLGDELAKNYADTPYAALAALQLAEVKFAAGDLAAAATALEQAGKLSQDPALTSLASVRLARVMLAQGQGEAALKLIEPMAKDSKSAYAGLLSELRGDTLKSLGRDEEAKQAYQAALTALDSGAPNRRIVEMKLTDLGGSAAAQPEA
ncbi:MAG: tetratricopeptide repeat protein [Chiayiivirga sp.]|jgi:predicted negative regulator of RcsB-dependent stress response|uniref:YfgM family protein n=1 Tax=Chiayiivirga sp. TaxID=2041042 RepID=UPI0025C689D2|nr:tetratricopeptide repeat protein [Chiayiivirga sp.]MCI1709763.1 tetratricopeptide repeat protein [Chiayiivirga sp.]MCI1729931.1 tetratricopeptide repeat protein [Chiayiivirga sp.]